MVKQGKALPSKKHLRTAAGLETYPLVTAQSMGITPQELKLPGRGKVCHTPIKPHKRAAHYTDGSEMHVEWCRWEGAGRQELQ